jgi:hypothetical protein
MKSLLCPRSPFASLDHIRLEDSWDRLRTEPLHMADGVPASPELTTSVRCSWSDQFLFAIFCCSFRELKIIPDPPKSPADRRTPLLWELSDVVEIFIGAGAQATGRYFEIQIAPDGRWTDMRIVKTVNGPLQYPDWRSEILCKSFIDGTGSEWRAAVAVPWKSLDSRGALEVPWDCNFYRASGKTHGDELFAWAPTGYGSQCFHRPDKFGRLELLNEQYAEASARREGRS